MLEIVIPTLNRLKKQITLSGIPSQFRKEASLVVQPHEEEEAKKLHDKVFVVSGDGIGFANTIKEITHEWSVNRGSRFWIMDDNDNLKQIKDMTLSGLEYDFFGKDIATPTRSQSEEEFNINIDEKDKKYAIRGFIDKLFLYKKKKLAIIRDFKSSKQVFKGKEVTNNLQHLMYSLAVKHLYPDYLKRQSEFVFLKFDLG